MGAVLTATVSLVAAPGAAADGGPIDVSDSAAGVTAPGSKFRYFALIAPKGTVVAQVARDTGRVERDVPLRGDFGIPGVGFDEGTGGLAHDGRTLVLAERRATFPRRHSSFAVFGARDLRLRKLVRLKGDFSYDALSPDGRTLYLVQYLSAGDPTKYAVRAYDLPAHRLDPDPIVDPNEHAGEMRGYPVSRSYSPDGRWAYTLYDGNGEEPFVHALDTVRGRAVCIDAPILAHSDDIFGLTLRTAPDGRTVSVLAGHRPVATVDARTFRAGAPRAAARPARGSHDGGGVSAAAWSLVAFGLLGSGALALLLRSRRRPATG